MTNVLQEFLQKNPSLLQSPSVTEMQPQEDRPVWQDVPDRYCCYVCNGSGLVTAEVMRRFVSPDYDPIISKPVRCDRSFVCGHEKQRLADPDHGDRQLEFNRYQGRPELSELPRELADQWHQQLKAEAKALALSGDRAERIALVRNQLQQFFRKATTDAGLLA